MSGPRVVAEHLLANRVTDLAFADAAITSSGVARGSGDDSQVTARRDEALGNLGLPGREKVQVFEECQDETM